MNMLKEKTQDTKALFLIDKITHAINFVPVNLRWITEVDFIEHEGFRLKTSILLDIIHGLRVKYTIYEEKDCTEGFPLSSTIMMENYGNQYKRYIEYLTDDSGTKVPIFIKTRNHQAGITSTRFAINYYYLDEKYFFYKNDHKKVVKRKRTQIKKFISDRDHSIIPVDIRLKLFEDLCKFKLDPIGAKHTLDVLHEQGKLDAVKYEKNLQTVESMIEGIIECSADKHGRMHTIITRLKREVRSTNLMVMTENGLEETVEFDIKNSQPTMFLKILRDRLLEININEFYDYKEICKSGVVYDKLIDCYAMAGKDKKIINRKQAKELMYKYLFGPAIIIKDGMKKEKRLLKNAIVRIFGKSIDKWLTNFKYNHVKGYAAFSWLLQEYESKFIFDNVIRKIIAADPTIPIATVHDSIIVPKSKAELVEKIFNKCNEEIFDNL